MAETPRLNGVINALEQGKPAFVCFSAAEIGVAQAIGAAAYDGVVFEMEHRPYDIRALRDCLQYMLDRRQIARSGSVAPAVTPFVRIPPNGGEISQWVAKQVLDQGVYGIVWPHVSTVEEARNAVTACRYPRPPLGAYFEPAGQRGDAPAAAARYWGLTQQEYYARADVWPLNPQGEILVAIMCEEVRAIKNLPKMLEEVPGIGVVIIGEGDLSQDLGLAPAIRPSHRGFGDRRHLGDLQAVQCRLRTPSRRQQECRGAAGERVPLSDAGAGLFLCGAGARPQGGRAHLIIPVLFAPIPAWCGGRRGRPRQLMVR